MKVELPELKRCCFCLPLRRGIIAFGYLNLVVTIATIALYCFVLHHKKSFDDLIFKGMIVKFELRTSLTIVCIDVIAIILLLVGAHVKSINLLKLYLRYSVVTILAVMCLYVAMMTHEYIGELPIAVLGLGCHGYLLLMVWSEIKKLTIEQTIYLI